MSARRRWIPTPAEAVLLLVVGVFSWKLFGGTENDALFGVSTVAVVLVAWVAGVVLRSALGDMRAWLAVFAVLALLVPWLGANTVQVSLMAQVCVFALMLLGLNLLTGYTGQISLGHGALLGISAYTTAILITQHDWHPIPACLAAIALTGAVGFALGVPALRLAGPYLAIATLAAALVFPGLLKHDEFAGTTGGVQGIHSTRISAPEPAGSFLSDHAPSDTYRSEFQRRRFAEESWVYYVTLIPAAFGLFAAWNLGRSRFGRAFIAVRDHDVAATSVGIDPRRYRILAFGVSGLYAGAAGALLFLVINFVAPDSFDLTNTSINPLAYLVIGGLASPGGSIAGALGYIWVPQSIAKVGRVSRDFGNLQGAMTGVLLIVIMTRMPEGVWGAAVRLNRLGWADTLRWPRTVARNRSPYALARPLAAVAIVAGAGLLLGGPWAVFAAAFLLVAPLRR